MSPTSPPTATAAAVACRLPGLCERDTILTARGTGRAQGVRWQHGAGRAGGSLRRRTSPHSGARLGN